MHCVLLVNKCLVGMFQNNLKAILRCATSAPTTMLDTQANKIMTLCCVSVTLMLPKDRFFFNHVASLFNALPVNIKATLTKQAFSTTN